jgi:hypothetical protein
MARSVASAPLLAALLRAEVATAELTTRGASALSALRSAVAAVASAAAASGTKKASNAGAANAAANSAAASAPPSLTEEEVQAVWDAALKLWVSTFSVFIFFPSLFGAVAAGVFCISLSPSLIHLSSFFLFPSEKTEHLRRRLQRPAAPGVARGRKAARLVRSELCPFLLLLLSCFRRREQQRLLEREKRVFLSQLVLFLLSSLPSCLLSAIYWM